MASTEADPVTQQDETVDETSQEVETKEAESESVGEDLPLKGGFECEFVETPPDVLQTECPVCLQILREPHQVTCCGKSYCKVCIEQLKVDNKACPTCKEEKIQDFPNKGLRQPLYKQKVRCTHQKEGCEWTGELGELDNHLNLEPIVDQELEGCDYAEINCRYSYVGCPTKLSRLQMKAHMKDEMVLHLQLLEKQFENKSNELKEAKVEILTLNTKLTGKNDEWLKKIQKYFPIPPVTLTMKHFGYHKENYNGCFSPPFYTNFRGYKMCIGVFSFDREFFVSKPAVYLPVELRLMKGEFDHELKWPYEQKVELEVLSQDTSVPNVSVVIYNKTHREEINYNRKSWEPPKITKVNKFAERVTEGYISEAGISTPKSRQLIKLSEVDKFVSNDCMEFRITKAGMTD